MRVACLGGGPCRALFRHRHEAARRRPRDRRGRAQPALRHLRLGRGALRRDARQPARPPIPPAPKRSAARSSTGTISPSSTAAPSRARRATASAASAASGCSTSCRTGRARSASSCASRPRSTASSPIATTTSSSAPTASTPRCAAPWRTPSSRTSTCAPAKYIWLGTHQKFDDAFTFVFEETEHGWIWAHAYQFDADTATFIVECSEATWRRLGFDRMSQEETIAACERIFARNLGGHRLMTNARHLRGSAWLNFNRVLCETWSHDNVVLMGDAAATAHFSVGSGTKLALESAIALAEYLHTEPDHAGRLPALRGRAPHRGAAAAERGAQLHRMVRGGRALSPSRSGAVQLFAADPLAAHQPREPARPRQGVAGGRGDVVRGAGDRRAAQAARPPMFTPFRLRDLQLKNRIVVSPMAQYRAVDGTPTDWHFVH